MNFSFVSLASLIFALLFFACSEKESSHPPLMPPVVAGSACPDLSGTDTSFGVFTQTLDIWAQTFADQHAIPAPDLFYFSIRADTLQKYLMNTPGCGGNCYDGIKAYLGLATSIDTISEVKDALCLILVPYKDNGNDTVFFSSYGPYIKVDSSMERDFIDSNTAQQYIRYWGEHFNSTEEIIAVPTYSFVIPRTTLMSEISKAQNCSAGCYDGNVYFVFGYHTISPKDSLYCFQNCKGHQAYPDLYGFAVHALILSVRKDGIFEHSSDFLRPCPRFCGTTAFWLNFP